MASGKPINLTSVEPEATSPGRSSSPALSSSSSSYSSTALSPASFSSSHSSATAYSPVISPSEDYHRPPTNMLKVATQPAVYPTVPTIAPPLTPIAPIRSQLGPNINKRPKLSLQTSCVPVTFGKSSTALSLAVSSNSCQSPTNRNTFKNAYETFHRVNSPICRSPLRDPIRNRQRAPSSPAKAGPVRTAEPPYKLPKGIRGILRNSPIPSPAQGVEQQIRSPEATMSTPSTKRVKYRYPLDEVIKTVKFTAKHSDIESTNASRTSSSLDTYSYTSSEEDSDSSDSASGGSTPSEDESENVAKSPKRTRKQARSKHKTFRSERQILAAGVRDGLLPSREDSLPPQTPIHQRTVQREWRWTLGPIQDGYVQSSSPPSSDLATPPADSSYDAPSTPHIEKRNSETPLAFANMTPPPSQGSGICSSPVVKPGSLRLTC
ncbi:hypothetical protein MGYG_06859 [Nannizzia gypsea CBS 118893]|uniref:Uncharacterized protein n=1 Tax=Arthroderma gypseum (strain ATCC MYA-4604 / CBS 118893) TaxID=535722 RepID=E4V1E5_ARTGP|nr:hypothetical protein MGYG_06859 [Nannizzia gypsea CBS 118893]EFR03860.1 hypothetical protein MGYG_06859 [Nannizzia gypsea CBS 118893]